MDWLDLLKLGGTIVAAIVGGVWTVGRLGWRTAQNLRSEAQGFRDRLTALEKGQDDLGKAIENQPTAREFSELKAVITKGFGDLQIHLGGFQGIGGLMGDAEGMRKELDTVDERITTSRHLLRNELGATLLASEDRLALRIQALETLAQRRGERLVVVEDRLKIAHPRE